MGTTLRLYDGAGVMLDVLPDFTDLDASDVLNDVGACSFTYPREGLNAALLDTAADRTIGVVLDGAERMRFLLEDDGRDEADATAPLTISGRSTMALLERGLVWPFGSAATRDHANVTPGTLVLTYGWEAQNRGVFPTVTFASFSTTHDSAGQPWAHVLTISYDVGRVTLLALVLDLAERGVVDVRMVGTDLRMYNPGTALAAELPGVVLRRGRDLRSAPRSRTRRDIATTVLMVGEDGASHSATDAPATTTYGRREVYESASGVTSAGTLAVLAGLTLTARKQPKRGHTTTLNPDPDTPVPWADFDLGAWIRQDALDGTVERVRVRSIGVKRTSGEDRTVELVLNDRFEEAEVRIARQIAGITGGSGATVGVPNTRARDRVAPAAPAVVTIASAVYQASDGAWLAQATLAWPDVTTNADGTAADDVDGYYVAYLLPNSPTPVWSPESFTSVSTVHLDGLPTGRQIQARVRTRDRADNRSGYRTSAVATLASDAAGPQTPSAPDATATIGGARFTWDGLGADGFAMPGDFDRAVLYVSTVNGFAPSVATARGDYVSAASVTVAGLPYVAHYAKLVAYDRAGNPSGVSAEVAVTPRKVTGSAGSTSDFAAVTIGDADVGNMSATRLTAGSLLADMVLGARIKTADTGARVELNSTGVKVYNAANTLMVDLNSNGTATFRGILVASNYYSRDTHPRIEIGPDVQHDDRDVIRFTNPDGSTACYIKMQDASLTGGVAEIVTLGVPPNGSRNGATIEALSLSPTSGGSIVNLVAVGGKVVIDGKLDNTNSNALRTSPGLTGKVARWNRQVVTTDANGFATIAHGLGILPEIVLATASSPNSGTGAVGSLVTSNFTSTQFTVRAWNITGGLITNSNVTVNYLVAN